MLTLEFPGEPKAVQSFRFTRGGHRYQPGEVVDWKNYIKLSATQQLPEGFKPFTGPVEIIEARFVFAPLKSWSKKKLALLEGGATIYKITKPDLTDNLFKGLIDALAGVVWQADQQVCKVRESIKVYGVNPRAALTVREIDEVEHGGF